MIAGVLLITVPAKVTENKQNTLNAETYVQDGIEYQTVYISGDSDPEQSMVIFDGVITENYRYVFLDDWDMVAHQVGFGNGNRLQGKNIILDLCGHKINCSGNGNGGYMFNPVSGLETIEFTDSSVVGGGSINTSSLTAANTIIVSGNGEYVLGYGAKQMNIVIRGGKSVQVQCWGEGGVSANLGSLTLAPYMQFTRETGAGTATNKRYYAPTHDYYAVSTSTVVAGIANYEYGYRQALTVGELANLAVPANQTYYLWGCKAGGSYEYLHLRHAQETQNPVTIADLNNLATWGQYGSGAQNIKASSTPTADGYDNYVTVTCASGWEILAIPVSVMPHTNYEMSAYVAAPNFEPRAPDAGLFFGAMPDTPQGGGRSEDVQEVLGRTYITPNTQGAVSFTFNTGEFNTVFLVINGGYCRDGQGDVTFLFNNVQLHTYQTSWVAA